MTEKQIKNEIRRVYNLRPNVRIRNINLESQTFVMRIGDCESCEVILPESVRRHIRIDKILNG